MTPCSQCLFILKWQNCVRNNQHSLHPHQTGSQSWRQTVPAGLGVPLMTSLMTSSLDLKKTKSMVTFIANQQTDKKNHHRLAHCSVAITSTTSVHSPAWNNNRFLNNKQGASFSLPRLFTAYISRYDITDISGRLKPRPRGNDLRVSDTHTQHPAATF